MLTCLLGYLAEERGGEVETIGLSNWGAMLCSFQHRWGGHLKLTKVCIKSLSIFGIEVWYFIYREEEPSGVDGFGRFHQSPVLFHLRFDENKTTVLSPRDLQVVLGEEVCCVKFGHKRPLCPSDQHRASAWNVKAMLREYFPPFNLWIIWRKLPHKLRKDWVGFNLITCRFVRLLVADLHPTLSSLKLIVRLKWATHWVKQVKTDNTMHV